MQCSHCGADTIFANGRCSACGTPLSASRLAAGNLTPVPEDWGVTRLPDSISARPTEISSQPAPRAANTPGLAPGQAFGTRYRVLRVLGQGGMGCVYQAWDSELGVAVALKVIRPEINDDPDAVAEIERRFKRELLLARQVSHRNVVRIHDLGDVDGTKYITMTYVEGADLAAMLEREGRMPLPRVLQYARQVAAGLQAAHEVGVVHRDLKPANIMIDAANGCAQIMDFGIARSTASDSGVGTMVGTVVGTIDYMAPEQAQGQVVDQRADIYAFGLILYDLLLGRRITTSVGAVTALMDRIKEAPPSARSIDPSITEAVDALITKCLQPNPGARYQTSTELIAALDALDDAGRPIPERNVRSLPRLWLVAAAVLIASLVSTATWWVTRSRIPEAPVTRDPVSVLIADFDNRAGDPVFDGTLENALTVAMEGAPFVATYSRTTAKSLNEQLRPGEPLDEEGARLISQREGLKVVLAGSVARSGEGYEIEVHAIDSIPGTRMMTARAEADDKSEVLDAVSRVAAQVREALGDTTTESGRLAARETFTAASLDAAREYALAHDLANQGKDEEALPHYERAVQHDPDFGRAYSGLATSLGKLGRTEDAVAAWKKTLSLINRMTDRERYRSLGTYYLSVAGNPELSLQNYRELVAKYPADTAAHNNLALSYFDSLQFAKAREEGERLVEIMPASVLYRYNYSLYAMYAGDFDASARAAEAALKINPATPKAYLALAMAALARNDADAARRHYEVARERSGARGVSLAAIGLADLAMFSGRFADAEQLLRAGIADDRDSKNTIGAATKLIALAEALQAQGRTAAALKTVEEALAASKSEQVTVPAARMYLALGRTRDAAVLAGEMSNSLQPRRRAFGKLIEGEIALAAGKTVDGVEALREARRLADLWLVRHALGQAYVQHGVFPEALAELDACEKRRGEATSVFLTDIPSWRYTVPLKYWLARAQEGIGVRAQAAENYKTFLSLRPSSTADPLVVDARKRVAS